MAGWRVGWWSDQAPRSDAISVVREIGGGLAALAIVAGWPVLIVSGLIIAAGIAWRIEERSAPAAPHRRS